MHIPITGSAGMLGRKRAARPDAPDVTRLSLTSPEPPAGAPDATCLTTPGTAARLVAPRAHIIFHLAAVRPGAADVTKDYRATRDLFMAIRRTYRPRLVFAPSAAAVAALIPAPVPDEFHTTPPDQPRHPESQPPTPALRRHLPRRHRPAPAHGLHPPRHAEQCPPRLLFQHPARTAGGQTRRPAGAHHDLPRPNLAALRQGLPAAHRAHRPCPTSPRRALSMPGLSATAADQIAALRRIAGDSVVALIRHDPDPAITRLSEGRAPGFTATRAPGFTAKDSFDAIIHAHIEDELQP